MPNYYLMFADSEWGGPFIEVVSAPSMRATKGKSLLGENVELFYRLRLVQDDNVTNPDEFPPLDLHESAKFRLFSRKFIELLQDLGVDNIEYFPTELVYAAKNQYLDYAVANVVGKINALNLDDSVVIRDSEGNIVQITSLVLDENKIAAHKFFWLGEVPLIMIVHRSIKEMVEERGLAGFFFVEDHEYEPGMI